MPHGSLCRSSSAAALLPLLAHWSPLAHCSQVAAHCCSRPHRCRRGGRVVCVECLRPLPPRRLRAALEFTLGTGLTSNCAHDAWCAAIHGGCGASRHGSAPGRRRGMCLSSFSRMCVCRARVLERYERTLCFRTLKCPGTQCPLISRMCVCRARVLEHYERTMCSRTLKWTLCPKNTKSVLAKSWDTAKVSRTARVFVTHAFRSEAFRSACSVPGTRFRNHLTVPGRLAKRPGTADPESVSGRYVPGRIVLCACLGTLVGVSANDPEPPVPKTDFSVPERIPPVCDA